MFVILSINIETNQEGLFVLTVLTILRSKGGKIIKVQLKKRERGREYIWNCWNKLFKSFTE